MSGCTDWSSFCAATANSTAFPALCSNSYTAPAPAAAAPSPAPQLEAPAAKAAAAGSPGAAGGRPSPSPAPSPVPEGGASLAGSPTATTASDGNDASEGPCYSDPTAASCAGFVRSDSESEADIQQLCAAMPNMSGCTLWQACTGARRSLSLPLLLLLLVLFLLRGLPLGFPCLGCAPPHACKQARR